MARTPPARASTCGFYLPLAGSLRAMLGRLRQRVLARPTAASVTVDYGCGAHSQATLVLGEPARS